MAGAWPTMRTCACKAMRPACAARLDRQRQVAGGARLEPADPVAVPVQVRPDGQNSGDFSPRARPRLRWWPAIRGKMRSRSATRMGSY